ncbi:MAG: hypothetical protein NUV77_25515, partial [Thermoguttaceae bacterium]|nr:hypothetical protein [Thermoguttaceae bacterium]
MLRADATIALQPSWVIRTGEVELAVTQPGGPRGTPGSGGTAGAKRWPWLGSTGHALHALNGRE